MQRLIDQLEASTPGRYDAAGPLAVEPTAWAAIALADAGREEAASRAARWLAELQAPDGSLGVTDQAPTPCWPTSLALLAWHAVDPQAYQSSIERAVAWTLAAHGTTTPQRREIGHDTTLTGWSWAAKTHSWLEPTAFAVMALRACGLADHPRTTEAVALLHDRLLPGGGCNYGNTRVLGQTLLAHLQPSGIVLWALADGSPATPAVERSLEYLAEAVEQPTGTASLAYALCALTAWGERPVDAERLIGKVLERPATNQSTYKLALLALASQEHLPLAASPSRRVASRRSDET